MPESPKKILIIDDDKLFAQILTDRFRESGFTVFNAYDGLEGIRVYMEALPDVVLCDLIMPQMGGAGTCSEIYRLAGAGQPVIVMISSTFQKLPHEHYVPEMGSRVHIPKYTRPVDIVIIVEQLLERKKYLQD